MSPHLASRLEVGEILAADGPPTVEFRASIIIGPGSLSFDLIRGLVNRLPVMIAPRWVRAQTQPIAIEDVVAYLLHGLDLEAVGHEVFEIGGPERVTYGELMQEYARQIGVRRVMVPVPLLSPRLSSLWLGLVTPALRASRPEADRQPPHRDGRERPGGPRVLSGASSAG